jgi:hypothetical protein
VQHAQHLPPADVAVATAAVGISVAYACLVSMCLSAFWCLSVDGSHYWARDMRLRCWSREHARQALALGVPGVAALCVRELLALVVFLSQRTDRTMRQREIEIRFGFLYRVYRPGKQLCWTWWHCWRISCPCSAFCAVPRSKGPGAPHKVHCSYGSGPSVMYVAGMRNNTLK